MADQAPSTAPVGGSDAFFGQQVSLRRSELVEAVVLLDGLAAVLAKANGGHHAQRVRAVAEDLTRACGDVPDEYRAAAAEEWANNISVIRTQGH